jgi:hypothetical protein
LAKKQQSELVYQFKKLESHITLEDGEILLDILVDMWIKLAKRFVLQDEEEKRNVYQCVFYVDEITRKFPQLKLKYLYHHYDEAVDEFLGKPYRVRQDKKSQELLGYKGVLVGGKSLYLFPLE